MTAAFTAILPVLIVTALGWGLANSGAIPPAQWRGVEALAYFVLFPTVVVTNLTAADFAALPVAGLAFSLVGGILAMTAICFALRRFAARPLRLDGPRFTSVLQGTTRWNAFIALAVAGSLLGPDGLALIAVAILAIVPLVNLINVAALATFTAGRPPSVPGIARDLVLNPFIIACAVGVALNLSGAAIPEVLQTTLDMIGAGALAIGILAVGAGLDLGALRRPGPALATATVLRLVGMPILVGGFGAALDLSGAALAVAIISAGAPAASSAYVLALRMGGDAKLMSEIITLQTLLAGLTIPLCLALLA